MILVFSATLFAYTIFSGDSNWQKQQPTLLRSRKKASYPERKQMSVCVVVEVPGKKYDENMEIKM